MSEVTLKDGREIKNYKPRKKKMWWRYLLMWFTGFLSCVLVIGIAGVLMGTVFKTGQVIGMFGLDAESILQPEYQGMTLLQLISSLPSQKFETLGDIDKVTPTIKNALLTNINPALEKEVHYQFKWDEIKTKPFTLNKSSPRSDEEYDHTMSLMEFIPHAMKTGIKIGNFFKKDGKIVANGVLKYIVYPIVYDEVNKKYVVNENASEDELVSLQDIIDGGDGYFDKVKKAIVIGDVIDTSTSPFLQQVATWTLADFNDTNIKQLEIGKLIEGGGPFIDQIRELGWTIGDLNDTNIKTLQIGKLFTDEEAKNNKLLQTIKAKGWAISDLTDFSNITGLKLEEVIDTTKTDFLKAIGGYKFDEIMANGFVEGLPLKDLFPKADGVLKALANMTYKDDQGEHYYTVGDLNNNNRVLALKISDIFTGLKEGDILYSFKDNTLKEISEKDISTVRIIDIFPDYKNNSILKAVVDLKGIDEETNKPKATIGDLTNQETINSIPLSAVVTAGDNVVLKSLINLKSTIGNLSSKIESLTLRDVIDIGTDPTSMIYKIATSEALKDCPITSIGAKFSSLKISDLFNIDEKSSPQVLIALKDTTLNDLSNAMKDLRVKDVMKIYPGDIYKRSLGGDAYEYYILHSEDWEKVPNEELSEELAAYYTKDTGYIAKKEAKEFTGTDVPSKTDTELKDAKPRDSLYAVGNTVINDSSAMIIALRNSLALKDVVDIDENSPQVLQSLKYTKLVDIPERIAELKLSDIINIDPASSSNIMNILAGVTVFGEGNNNLQHALENLNIIELFGDAMYEKDEKAASRNSIRISFTPLDGDVNKGAIVEGSNADVLAKGIINNTAKNKDENIFVYDSGNNNYYYDYVYSASEYSIAAINPAVREAYKYVTGSEYQGTETFDEKNNSLTASIEMIYKEKDVFYQVKIESIKRQKINMTYWFMFTTAKKNDEDESYEKFSDIDKYFVLKEGYSYTVNSMSKFTDNMFNHVKTESLQSLHDAGLITDPDPENPIPFNAVLNDKIMGTDNPYGGRTFGSLTINELIDLINRILPYISH